MGRALITGGGADGLYSIRVDTGSERVAAEITRLTGIVNELKAMLVIYEAALEAEEDIEIPLREALSDAIDAYIAAYSASPGVIPQAELDAVNAATAALYTQQARTRAAAIERDRIRFELKSHERALAAQEAIVTSSETDAWCVDLTEDGEGSVATCEIPGEPQRIVIAAGARVPVDSDGQLLTRPAMRGTQAYFNAAILPGWQKWMPDYRSGIISDIDTDEDTATVTLDSSSSSAQGLDVNQAQVLTAVPVVYMTCNATAFAEGDHVVVEFQDRDWSRPRVIGFVSNPKMCARLAYLFTVDKSPLNDDYPPDIQPATHDWTTVSIVYYEGFPPDYENPLLNNDYTDGGIFYFGNAAQHSAIGFREKGLQPLTDVREIRAKFNVQGFNTYEGIILTFWASQSGLPPAGKMYLDLLFRNGTNKSRFICADEYVAPLTDTATCKYFTFPTQNVAAFSFRIKVMIGLTSQKLYIDDTLIATLTNSYPASWAEFNYISSVPLFNPPNAIPSIDYITAL